MSSESIAQEELPDPSERLQAAPFQSVSAEDFKTAFRFHPGGVALITATGPAGHAALTATSVASVSADPPLLVFSVSDQSSTAPTITTAETVVVHLLDADTLHLGKLGATSGIDRFADTELWTTLVTGDPVFHGTRWISARVVNRFETGTATLIVAQAIQSNVTAGEAPGDALVYHNRSWHRLGEHSRVD